MDLLPNIFGIKVQYESWNKQSSLPLYITAGYEIQAVMLNSCKCILLTPTQELATLPAIKKHIKKIQDIENVPVVLLLSAISAYRRKNFIESGIPFITSKQAYLPFMGAFLAKENEELASVNKFMFSTQQLVLLYLYGNEKQLYVSEATKRLPFTAMTMSRAVKQLEQTELFQISKKGVSKVIASEYDKRELFEKVKGYLQSPVRKTSYIEKDCIADNMVLAGETGLAEYTMLNPSRLETYAVYVKDVDETQLISELVDPDKQVRVEMWEYNPLLFSNGHTADKLSIALSFAQNGDERIEEAVEELLESVWRA